MSLASEIAEKLEEEFGVVSWVNQSPYSAEGISQEDVEAVIDKIVQVHFEKASDAIGKKYLSLQIGQEGFEEEIIDYLRKDYE